jgi:hypothetical protein
VAAATFGLLSVLLPQAAQAQDLRSIVRSPRIEMRPMTYEVTLDEATDFGPFSAIHISFGGTNAIDINLNAAGLFPPLEGRAVTFHADFGDFSHSIFTSDALPTNTALGLSSFQDASVTLLPSGGAIFGSLNDMTSFKIAPVPEPSTCALAIIGLPVLLLYRSGRSALPPAQGMKLGPSVAEKWIRVPEAKCDERHIADIVTSPKHRGS